MLFIPYYISWHYGRALTDIFRIWTNFLWFIYHFFSIPFLLSTLFSPWRRLHETYKGGLDFAELGTTIVINILMRIVGAVARLAIILFGLGILLSFFVLGILFFILWVLMPLIIVTLFTTGVRYLFM